MGSTRMIIVLFALSLLAGCVMPQDGTSGGGSASGKSGAKGGGSIVVCGEKFAFGDVLEHPVFRQALQQFITLQQLYAQASEEGITVSDSELKEEMDKQKEQITSSGQSWEEFLEMQGMTEGELEQMLKTQKLFEGLMDKKLDFSDENMQKQWNDNKDIITNQHIQANFLPEAEGQSLTYEDCIDTIKDFIRQSEGFSFQQELMDSLTLNASIDLSGVLPAEQAEAVTLAVLGRQQEQIRERLGDMPDEPDMGVAVTDEPVDTQAEAVAEEQPSAEGDAAAAPEEPAEESEAEDTPEPVEPELTETE